MCRRTGLLALTLLLLAAACFPALSHALYELPRRAPEGQAEAVGPGNSGSDMPGMETAVEAMLLYGGYAGDPQAGRKELMALYGMLRAYSGKLSLLRLEDYRPGMLDGVKVVLVAGADGQPAYDAAGRDLQQFAAGGGGRIGWIGGGLEHYAPYGLLSGFRFDGYTREIAWGQRAADGVEARSGAGSAPSRTMLGPIPFVAPKLAADGEGRVSRYGIVSDGAGRYPYAARSGNVWWIATAGREAEGNAMLGDVLDGIFADARAGSSSGSSSGSDVYHGQPRLYIRLNDLNPLMDLTVLEQTGRWLSEQGVPFVMELRPMFANTEYERMKAYFRTIRRLREMGGTPVLANLQGWSLPDEWNASIEDYSLSGGHAMIPEKLMASALAAYMQHGIYPMALSGPPDLLFDPDMKNVLPMFTLYVQSGRWQGYIRDMPPQQAWRGEFVRETEESGRQTQAAVIGFDPNLEREKLQMTVLAWQRQGIKPDDLSQVEAEVTAGDTRIAIRDGIWTINGARPPVYRDDEERQPDDGTGGGVAEPELSGVNKRIRAAMIWITVLAGLFVLLFLLAFAAGKTIDRKKHLR